MSRPNVELRCACNCAQYFFEHGQVANGATLAEVTMRKTREQIRADEARFYAIFGKGPVSFTEPVTPAVAPAASTGTAAKRRAAARPPSS